MENQESAGIFVICKICLFTFRPGRIDSFSVGTSLTPLSSNLYSKAYGDSYLILHCKIKVIVIEILSLRQITAQ